MNYIGSKNKLSPWIQTIISNYVSGDLKDLVFCDLFAGTGIIGRRFKPLVKKVISNDVEFYSYVLLKNYIENHQSLTHQQAYLDRLNALPGKTGFIADQYGENGSANRLFFTEQNAKKIDAARQQIEDWKNQQEISTSLYYFLLTSLLESADKIANTASVYGAYLKKIKKSAAKELIITGADFIKTDGSHQVFHTDANQLIKKIKGDILYLDPPYNARQYGANYHLLNTIAQYKKFIPKGKTGLPSYYRSTYCRKNEVEVSFKRLIEQAQFTYIFLSYNNEGLMSPQTIKEIMQSFGEYHLETKNYQRFKADKSANRNHRAKHTTEYLHCLIKK